jgi:putative glycerol-1-phosphate prenyltransferase
MDAGSGAKQTIEAAMIEKVKEGISIPLIVGGGIKSADDAKRACDAGADMIVIGNAFEKDSNLVKKISNVFNK